MSDITLTEASRNALLSLSNTQELSGRTQGRLTTGKKVNMELAAYDALVDREPVPVANDIGMDLGQDTCEARDFEDDGFNESVH